MVTAPDPTMYRPHIGTDFTIDAGDWRIALRLASVVDDGNANGMRQFSLLFHGPGDRVLSDGIYPMQHPALGSLDIFIVPIVGTTAARAIYQACFSAAEAAHE
jgi:hypothetical protein